MLFRSPAVVNVNVGVGSLVAPLGPPVIATVGATVSTVKARLALPWLPAVSVTVTVKVWAPSPSAPVANGEVHAAGALASTCACNFEPAFQLVPRAAEPWSDLS